MYIYKFINITEYSYKIEMDLKVLRFMNNLYNVYIKFM